MVCSLRIMTCTLTLCRGCLQFDWHHEDVVEIGMEHVH